MRAASGSFWTALAAGGALLRPDGGGGDGAPTPGARRAAAAVDRRARRLDRIRRGHQLRLHYEDGYLFNGWAGGNPNPTWQGSYQLCHDSAQAYGDVLAPMVGATLAKFACTGSTYQNGITFDRMYAGSSTAPRSSATGSPDQPQRGLRRGASPM